MRQRVLQGDGHRFGEVSHCAEASAGGAVVQQAADSSSGVNFQHGVVCAEHFLPRGKINEVTILFIYGNYRAPAVSAALFRIKGHGTVSKYKIGRALALRASNPKGSGTITG